MNGPSVVGAHVGAGSEIIRHQKQVIAPGAEKRYAFPPMAVRLAADLRPSADGSAVRTSLVVGQLQAASVPVA